MSSIHYRALFMEGHLQVRSRSALRTLRTPAAPVQSGEAPMRQQAVRDRVSEAAGANESHSALRNVRLNDLKQADIAG